MITLLELVFYAAIFTLGLRLLAKEWVRMNREDEKWDARIKEADERLERLRAAERRTGMSDEVCVKTDRSLTIRMPDGSSVDVAEEYEDEPHIQYLLKCARDKDLQRRMAK